MATLTDDYQPEGRYGHSTVRIGDCLYMWCGNLDESVEVQPSCIEVFNLNTYKWEQKQTTGDPPVSTRYYASTAIGNEIFYFGGSWEGNQNRTRYSNSLYSLNVLTLTWRQLSPNTLTDGHPSKKGLCGMVSFVINGNEYLVVIGGFGPINGNTLHQAGAQYSNEGDFVCLDNEIHYYHLATGQWSSPQVNGNRLPPCNGFTLTSVGVNSAVLYGGNSVDCSCNNDVYVMTFEKESVISRQIASPFSRSIWPEGRENHTIWPEGRENHASVVINCESGPHLLVVGGYPNPNDCWLFDINQRMWIELVLPDTITGRNGHSLALSSITPTSSNTWIIIVFGGFRGSSKVSDTTAIELTKDGDRWLTAWYSVPGH